MQPEKIETEQGYEYSPDLFSEPRDHANQWDVSAIWFESEHEPEDSTRGLVVE